MRIHPHHVRRALDAIHSNDPKQVLDCLREILAAAAAGSVPSAPQESTVPTEPQENFVEPGDPSAPSDADGSQGDGAEGVPSRKVRNSAPDHRDVEAGRLALGWSK